MLRFEISPSPTLWVILNRYERSLVPLFDQLFETPDPSSPLRHLCQPADEASYAVILENHSDKAISAWRFRWHVTEISGQQHPVIVSADSYAVDLFRPLAEPGSRHLITRSACVGEAMLHHALSGGGFVGTRVGGSSRPNTELAEIKFEVELVVFIDGEIAGPDPDNFVLELQGRKRAAEFVAKQIRAAQAGRRDVTPVLTALIEAPSLGYRGSPQGDPIFHSVRKYAGDYLRHMHRKIGGVDMAEATLRHLENRPTLPDFYRR
jgi:hypothetical protein